MREELAARAATYRGQLEAMGVAGRNELVARARRGDSWPEPQADYLRGHARKWGRGRSASQYAAWVQAIKNRPGVQVWAYIHTTKLNRGLAFVDSGEEAVVYFDCDEDLNYDCFTPHRPVALWLADKESTGLIWRLKDTEL